MGDESDKDYVNEVVRVAQTQAVVTYQDMRGMARDIAASGLFGMKNETQVLALMAVAQAEGKHPAIVARDYDIIQGRPAKKAEAMLRDFIASGGVVKWIELSDTRCEAEFSHPSGGTVRIDWDLHRVKRAEIKNAAMYAKYPRQMLRSRVVSEGVRAVCPLATSGFYVPEEVQDISDDRRKRGAIDAEVVTVNAGTETTSAPIPPSQAEGPGSPSTAPYKGIPPDQVEDVQDRLQKEFVKRFGEPKGSLATEYDPESFPSKGKYSETGKSPRPWKDVPKDYLGWAIENTRGAFRAFAKSELDRRQAELAAAQKVEGTLTGKIGESDEIPF
jgi:hypothetical protein